MLHAQAHSFAQQARLAITLAWVAGFTNAVTLLVCLHATSHVTGTASSLATAAIDAQWPVVALSGFLLVVFFLGAALSGLLTEVGRRRGWESIYVLPMLAEAMLLGAFALVLETGGGGPAPPAPADGGTLWLLLGLASAAMGLQNATITRISSGVVRTTHLTGVLTDLGTDSALLALWLRDRARGAGRTLADAGTANPTTQGRLWPALRSHPTARRLALLTSVLGSFVLGAALGTVAHEQVPRWAMLPPVLFLLFIVWQDAHTPICEIEPTPDDSGVASDLELPAGLALFRVRRPKDRADRVDRLPDLTVWFDRLPRGTRVAILDLSEAARLHADAAGQLDGLVELAARRGRHLILAGLTPEQYAALRHAAGATRLDPTNVCPDPELAIARGLALLHRATGPGTMPLT